MARKKGVPNVRSRTRESAGGDSTPPEPEQQAAPAAPSPRAVKGPAHTYYSSEVVSHVAQDPTTELSAGPPANGRPPPLPPGLDLFAEIYVPAWLRNVNVAPPAGVIPRSREEAAWINNEALVDELYPRAFTSQVMALEAQHRMSVSARLIKVEAPSLAPPPAPSSRIIPQRPGEARSSSNTFSPPAEARPNPLPFSLERQLRTKLPPLSNKQYAEFWVPLQLVEFIARTRQLRQARLYGAPIVRIPPPPPNPTAPPPPSLYILQARSIREGWPPVDLGDVLELRQLRPDLHTWQGLVFQASVDGVNRAKGEVILRCDGLRGYEESMFFNVIWNVQDRLFLHWRRATETLDFALNPIVTAPADSGRPLKSITETWLFPCPEDVHDEPSELPKTHWPAFDSSLNEEQLNAVKSILWAQHTVPFLISGPPGTGKTKTLVEAVLQLLKRYPTTHILVCGASSPSADTLAMRLRRELSPKDLFRLNSPSRPFAEVRGELLPYCYVEGERFSLPTTSVLLSKRVICCSVLDAALLLSARLSNHDLSSLQIHTLSTIHPKEPIPLAKPHFGFLLVDEAAQASEPDLACALSIVATDYSFASAAHVTICGDARQLGPVIVSPEARSMGLDVSLLERLMEREVYSSHPCARRNMIQTGAKWKLGAPMVSLTKNYRSATPILMLPSTLFYNETLEPFAPPSTHNSTLHMWSGLPNPGFPVLFRGVCGDDFPVDEGASFYNESEVTLVTQYVLSLVGSSNTHGALQASEVSVISPFREQVWRIRLALRAVGLHDVDVGNVEALQGAENRVVIISAVRSTQLRWLPADRAQSRGLIFEPKRLNVAWTRAKELMIVIGNPNTLTMDPYWLSFYYFCLRNGCYSGPPLARPSARPHASSNANSSTSSTLPRSQSAVSTAATTIQHEDDDDAEDELDDRFATAGVEAVSRLEQEWHASRPHRNGRTSEARQKSDFDILVGRMVGATFEE